MVVAARPGAGWPALGLAIAAMVGAVGWITARGIGTREHPAAVALSASLAAFLLAPAPLDPSPLPLALLGLVHLLGRRRAPAGPPLPHNDNESVDPLLFSDGPRGGLRDSLRVLRREG